jgi:hypothetical protein
MEGGSMKIKPPILLALGLVVLYLLFWPSEKDHLNAQMAELCAKDGGVKVYEKVKLPVEMFEESGNLKNRKPIKENGHYVVHIGNEYVFFDEVQVIKDGNLDKHEGRLDRIHTVISKVSDNKVIGESVAYLRAGGDRWSAGMHSQDICPKRIDLFNEVFSKE